MSSTSAAAERDRVRAKYAPMGVRELVILMLILVALIVMSRFRDVDWYFFAGIVAGAAGWEVTKFWLRRNAELFVLATGRERAAGEATTGAAVETAIVLDRGQLVCAFQLAPQAERPLTVMVEPGLAEFQVQPHEWVLVEIEGGPEPFEVVHDDDFIAIWTAPAHRISVTRPNGAAIEILGE